MVRYRIPRSLPVILALIALAPAAPTLWSTMEAAAQTSEAPRPPTTDEDGSAAPAGNSIAEAIEKAEVEVPPAFEPYRAELEARLAAAQTPALEKRLEAIRDHYAAYGYRPVWISDGAVSDKARTMVGLLERARDDGLRASDYDAAVLEQKLGAVDAADLADLEIHLTTAAVSFGQHMHSGRLDPSAVNREILIYPDDISADAILTKVRGTQSLVAFFRLLAPHTPRYERLRSALSDYRRTEAAGGWTIVAEGGVLKPGDNDPRVPALRKRMVEAGTYSGGDSVTVADAGGQAGGAGEGATDATATAATGPDPAMVYDDALVEAVKKFQDWNGLDIDGVVGPATLKVINIPVSERIVTMEVNMERNRWMQNDFGPYHILANLADQVVKVVENGDTIHAEVIQVGQPYHRTPVFTDEMEYVEINPYWNVPPSIAVNEYLPKLRRNPGVLAAQNIDLLANGRRVSAHAVDWSSYGRGNFPFRLQQRPGSGNALGRIKFMFPNRFNVYMHDTPSKSKFNAAQRYFSHGCLRLRDPLKMAEVVLGRQGWDRARIDSVVASGKRTVVKLDEKIPVHIVYITSYVNKDGSVHFREDVYGRDKIVAQALEKVRGS